MQPVLLGRSFAPLQGETGLCTAEIPSNHQTTRPSKDYCGGKDKGICFTPQKKHLIGAGEKVSMNSATRLFLPPIKGTSSSSSEISISTHV